MTLNIDSIVRSAAIIVVGLPISLGITASLVPSEVSETTKIKTASSVVEEEMKLKLTKPCVKWMLSVDKSDLEKSVELEINEIVGGKVDPQETCKWVLTT